MSEVKHTPGPWKIGEDSSTSVLVDAEYAGLVPVALCYDPNDHSHRTATGEANARLISVAPDMAEALREISECQGCQTCKRLARAALQKGGLL